jgi:hypothetical protein
MILLLLCVIWLVEMYSRWKFVAYTCYKEMLRICAQACKKITFNKLMQLMEHSMDIPNISMIFFLTRTVLDGEIIRTYIMGTRLNKAIKADSSIHVDFSPNRIIKWDNPLHSQIPMLWGHRVMIFVRWWKPWLLTQWPYNKISCLFNRKQGQVFTS